MNDDETEHFKVVFVCTGNRFRSPLAEHLLREAVQGLPVEAGSVGTHRLAEGPALPEAVELAAGLGVDLSAHRSRPLERGLLADADLVLGFERQHVARAVVDGGAARERTFTLGELCALLNAAGAAVDGEPVARARSAVREADRLRRRIRNPPPDAELADPFGGSAETYRRTAETVHDLTARLARSLFG